MTRRCLVLAALVAVATLAASPNVSAQAPIRIGVIEPLSGPVAASGNYIRMGAEIARDWINAKGGVNGRKVDLLIEDNKSDPKERSEEHTSELQSRLHLVCRLLLEKKKRQ